MSHLQAWSSCDFKPFRQWNRSCWGRGGMTRLAYRRRLTGLAASALAALTATAPRVASACGGFFCSQAPIDQSAEQIAFSLGPEGVTAYIQISYTGRAEDFAWIVPVMSAPTIGVGTQALFTALARQTQPSFQINWSPEVQGCFPRGGPGSFGANDGGVSDAAANAGPQGVQFLDRREVGPYDTVVLAAGDPDALITWLAANGYDQPPSAAPLIKHYVSAGMLFVALKLKRGADTGDILPLVLTMSHEEACVPLILTRVAAVPDMPVLVYVLGEGRAVPRNWFHVEVNPRRIDWLRGGANYRALATTAINEAAGHGFVTEYAGTTGLLRDTLHSPGRFNLTDLAAKNDAAMYVQALLSQPWPQGTQSELLVFLRKHIPLPARAVMEGVPENFVYSPFGASQYLSGIVIDGRAITADLLERLVKPLEQAQALLIGKPFVTRLLTTVSPDEMDRDPFFHFNRTLPNVSNIHVAEGTGRCDDGTIRDTNITLPNGEKVQLGQPWMLFQPPAWNVAANEGAAEHISLIGTAGAPVFVGRTQAVTVDSLLDTMDAETVRLAVASSGADPMPTAGASSSGRRISNLDTAPPPGWKPGTTTDGVDGGGSSCRIGASGGDLPIGALALVAVWLLARRRRADGSQKPAGQSATKG
jgi:hypothetical protein